MTGIQQFLDHPAGKNPPSDWNELHHAAFVKDVDRVRQILKSASRLLSVKDLSGWTPVHLACCGPTGWAFDLTWRGDHRTTSPGLVSSLIAPRRHAAYALDEDKKQEASHEILSLFILHGADIHGEYGSLTPALVAASTDMPMAARMLALFGVPIDPHRPGSPYQWAKQQQNDVANDPIRLSRGDKAEVWEMYRRLLGHDGQALLEKSDTIVGSGEWKEPDKRSQLLDVALRLERMLAIRQAKYRKSVQLTSGDPVIHLCPQCCSLGEKLVMGSFFPSSTKFPSDRARAWIDCDFCKILHVLLPNYIPGSVKRLRDINAERDWTSKTDGFSALNEALNQSGTVNISLEYNKTPVRLDVFPPVTEESRTLSDPDTTSADSNPASEKTLQFRPVEMDHMLGKRWLYHCRANHDRCSSDAPLRGFEANAGGTFPTRLIDVTRWEEKLIRICHSRDNPAPYTALSHRWITGPMPAWVAKKDNVQTRMSWFSSARLPKSIRDALQVTAELGIQYTWIDSICIVQDDIADWEREAAQMASIYTHAEVVIFADCASDDTKGFLGGRKCWTPYYPVAVEVVREYANDEEHLPTIVRYAYDVLEKPPRDENTKSGSYMYNDGVVVSFREDMDQSHLNDRGWILQERLMSRRSLHFGRSQMYWECPSTVVSESGDNISGIWHQDHQKWVIDARKALIGSSGSPKIAQGSWKDIVSTYSRMKLTKASDRLPAIESIAKAFSSYLDDKYFCGTWSHTFHEDLIWQVDDPLSAACGSGGHVTLRVGELPSWSWASVNAPITFKLKTPRVNEGGCVPDCSGKCYKLSLPLESVNGMAGKPRIKFLGCYPEGGQNHFSQQPSASIIVSACMREVIVLGPIKSTLGYLEPGFTPIYGDDLAPVGLAFFDEPEKHRKAMSGGQIRCLQVATKQVTQMSARQVADFMLLVVDRGADTYSRVGVAHTNIRQTSRYDTGSIFEGCEVRTVKLV